MSITSGGSTDPPRSLLSPKTVQLLTPKSKKTYNDVFLTDNFSSENYYSMADLNLLSREVEILTASFQDD